MLKKIVLAVTASVAMGLAGCASVPTASAPAEANAKAFPAPDTGNSGVYIYRDSFVGQALKKDLFVDGECIGQTSNKVFFYTQVKGDQEHTLSTESEFSPNELVLYMKAGANYFVRQVIKMGVFVGGAKLESVDDATGKAEVAKLAMATPGQCSK